ncbi:hypothetical protein ATANTOWER_013836 [Ataeniobius toweri]|uniref:Uncharacterized protein n=1 Tax=Ataeniobius toweri TaxID=208326 RepID=A0ABU7BVT8_9TELE|nr:hypothetical protein [Ataeniobius toweri]
MHTVKKINALYTFFPNISCGENIPVQRHTGLLNWYSFKTTTFFLHVPKSQLKTWNFIENSETQSPPFPTCFCTSKLAETRHLHFFLVYMKDNSNWLEIFLMASNKDSRDVETKRVPL